MKASRYNIFSKKEDKILGVNTRVGKILKLSLEEFETFEQMCKGEGQEGPLFDKLKTHGFFIEDTFDELEYLRFKYESSKYLRKGLSYIIAPIFLCNFGCEYCYVDRRAKMMSKEVRENIKKFTANRLKPKTHFDVVFTGGDKGVYVPPGK